MLGLLALLVLAGLWWLGRGGRLPRPSARQLGGSVLLVGAGLLAIRGQVLPAALLALAGFALLQARGPLAQGFGGWLARIGTAHRAARAAASVRTPSIDFTLAAGRPSGGLIRVGPAAGRHLAGCGIGELAALSAALRMRDPLASRLLETYLDGRQPGWRVDADGHPHPGAGRPAQPGAMTQEEAYQILGLERGASLEEIRAAHRALMKRLHPDQGGTAEGAALINAARDRLTNRHR